MRRRGLAAASLVGLAVLAASFAGADTFQRPSIRERGPCNYPFIPLHMRQEACCTARVSLDVEGQLTGADVACPNPMFALAARQCLGVMSFNPARRNGAPVPVENKDYYIQIFYRLAYDDENGAEPPVCTAPPGARLIS